MGFKTFASMNIAIIGNSEIALAYAKGFARAGHSILVAYTGNEQRPLPAGLDMYGDISLCSIAEASAIADLVVLATEPKNVREAAYWLGDVRRKVIIDCTGNVHTPDESLVNTVNAIKAITGSPHVVKVFNVHGYEALIKPLFGAMPVDLLLAGDSKKAKEITKIMAVEMGINNCYDFGGTDTLPLFNQLTKVLRNLALTEGSKATKHKVA